MTFLSEWKITLNVELWFYIFKIIAMARSIKLSVWFLLRIIDELNSISIRTYMWSEYICCVCLRVFFFAPFFHRRTMCMLCRSTTIAEKRLKDRVIKNHIIKNRIKARTRKLVLEYLLVGRRVYTHQNFFFSFGIVACLSSAEHADFVRINDTNDYMLCEWNSGVLMYRLLRLRILIYLWLFVFMSRLNAQIIV